MSKFNARLSDIVAGGRKITNNMTTEKLKIVIGTLSRQNGTCGSSMLVTTLISCLLT